MLTGSFVALTISLEVMTLSSAISVKVLTISVLVLTMNVIVLTISVDVRDVHINTAERIKAGRKRAGVEVCLPRALRNRGANLDTTFQISNETLELT